ncbi:hypothetical protein, partial [Enterobacter asburiae]
MGHPRAGAGASPPQISKITLHHQYKTQKQTTTQKPKTKKNGRDFNPQQPLPRLIKKKKNNTIKKSFLFNFYLKKKKKKPP